MQGLRWYLRRVRSYIGRPRLVIQQRAIVVDDTDYCNSPIFLIGPHRSGTSLLRRMFNAHPDIACPPESFFIGHYADMFTDHLVRAGYDGLGYDRAHARRDLARKASSLHEAFRLANGKAIWADKTPAYIDKLDQIDDLFDGKARYVMILRHPGDTVHSLWKRGWRFNAIEDSFEAALEHVRDGHARMKAFAQRHPDRCARIDYERLCADPATELTAAMAHLSLAFHPAMLDFASAEHNFGLEDPVVRGTRGIEASSGAWQSWNDEHKQRALETFGANMTGERLWCQP